MRLTKHNYKNLFRLLGQFNESNVTRVKIIKLKKNSFFYENKSPFNFWWVVSSSESCPGDKSWAWRKNIMEPCGCKGRRLHFRCKIWVLQMNWWIFDELIFELYIALLIYQSKRLRSKIIEDHQTRISNIFTDQYSTCKPMLKSQNFPFEIPNFWVFPICLFY
jgi:hypothetical protein